MQSDLYSRHHHLRAMADTEFDVLIVGGGINGAVAAAALAAKGAKVALVERSDFASGSSSQSSNLAWGGIKYLESGELLLVNKLCKSRNHLMQHYPSSVKEIRFFTSIRKGFRMPPQFVYFGALFYWLIGRMVTQAPRYLSAARIKKEAPFIQSEKIAGGLEYSDCYLPDNDSRFVFRFVRRSVEAGCNAVNYAEIISAQRNQSVWRVTVKDRRSDQQFDLSAKVLVNACGPYADQFNHLVQQQSDHKHLLSKGIHLVVDRIVPGDKIFAFFASDGRLFFIMPMGPKTCIGTTDSRVDQPDSSVSDEDRDFVLANANQLLNLAQPLTREDIIAERCGVRPLAVQQGQQGGDDWLHLSRKHAIDVNRKNHYISIFGGKLTDCINVGEEVAALVAEMGVKLGDSDALWYGEPPSRRKKEFLAVAKQFKVDSDFKTLSGEQLSERMWRRYGELAFTLLESIKNDTRSLEKPIEFIEYTRCEVALMGKSEMIVTLDDFLRRRSKVSQVVRTRDIIDHPGLLDVCELLFGDQAAEKLAEFRERVS